ncbi:type II toxin-antitoxin system SpoIISA family toxin [Viridibacillus sp. YIM B01967]|uniref:Type II toxin-antitoxin system SpoIISA family toxin n=1 Tax=Viridibacillus soli TaxID=2798301 RepID=A0ABS1H477_9BACL|nr:type II toxin-antitoxin system SpoIISA family toxin [Viridibacillus soli]MBK3493863.1 type II toxin-antitoxin system SpoIISA family toxin [Viridibacillus soli]
MEVKWYTVLILSLLLVEIACSVGMYIWNREFYLKHRMGIRKIYYSSIVIMGFFLWVFGAFPVSEIKGLVALVFGVIIIDLFVYQTPDITKFMSNELKQEELVQTINKNRGTFIELSEKLIKVNETMPKSLAPWQVDEFDFSFDKYEEFVLLYLKTFTSSFGLDLYSYYVESSNDNSVFVSNIKNAYEKIREDHNFSIRGVGMRKRMVINTLKDGENIEIIGKEGTYVLFPYFGEYFNLLFVISSKKDGEVTGADASLLLNMLYTLDTWLLLNENELASEPSERDEAEEVV